MSRVAIFWAMLFLVVSPILGQNTPAAAPASPSINPFELIHRLPKIATASGAIHLSNPFDVVPHRQPSGQKSSVRSAEKSTSFLPKIRLPKGKSQSKTFLFWSLVAAFGFLTFSVAANRSVVGKAWRAFLSDNQLVVAQREASGITGIAPYYLLYTSFLLNAGIFIFLITRFFSEDRFNNLPFLLLCLVAAGAIFLLKHLLLSIFGQLFPVEKDMGHYNFLMMIFNCVLGLFLVPFNFLIAFAHDYEAFLVFWTLGLILVFYGYRTVRAAGIGAKFMASSPFHFLLYLCCVEIAPVLLLFKLAQNQFGG